MLTWLGHFAFRQRRGILVATFLGLAVSLALLLRGGALSAGGTIGIESDTAQRWLESELAYPGDSSFMVLLRGRDLTPDDPRFLPEVGRALAGLRKDPRVRFVLSPDDAPGPIAERMLSRPSSLALAVVTLRDEFTQAARDYPSLRETVRSEHLDISFTGHLAFRSDLDRVLGHDLLIAELISLPLAMLVLVLVFRSVAAAALSVGVGALAVLSGIAIITALSRVTDIAVYAINVASLIGLGVAIDYSLFLVSRYRDELAAGADTERAIVRAMETAGEAVSFSGLAVGIGLGSLLFFHGSFLANMGLAAAIVVALAMLFALTFLPALLAVLGPRIDWGRVRLPRVLALEGGWGRVARAVMRRPLAFLLPTLAVLGVFGLPFFRLEMAAADVRTLPRGVEAREAFETLRREFPDQVRNRIVVVVKYPSAPALTGDRVGALHDFSQRVRRLPGVTSVESFVDMDPSMSREDYEELADTPEASLPPTARRMLGLVRGPTVMLLSVLTDAAPASLEAQAIVRSLREDRRVGDGEAWVAGPTAHDMDIRDFILERAPHAIVAAVAMTWLILFVLLRSLLLPVKAIVMNFLSLSASFGALVWIFQEGHLATWLHFEAAPLDPTLPVLLFCAVFGLSMDYEVLLLSRMKEEFHRCGDNTTAVAEGLQKSGRLVTSAAAIMVVVFAAFALSRVIVVKAMGVGLALAVALDATLVRILLVPATMRLLGNLNWWSPIFSDRPAPKPADPPSS